MPTVANRFIGWSDSWLFNNMASRVATLIHVAPTISTNSCFLAGVGVAIFIKVKSSVEENVYLVVIKGALFSGVLRF